MLQLASSPSLRDTILNLLPYTATTSRRMDRVEATQATTVLVPDLETAAGSYAAKYVRPLADLNTDRADDAAQPRPSAALDAT